jgi:opacity protein-like surface antigen
LSDYRLSSIEQPRTSAVTHPKPLLSKATLRSRCAIFGVVTALAIGCMPSTRAQATAPTATRKADLQIGGDFTFSPAPDYGLETFYGGGGYVTFDFTRNLGVELNFHQLNGPVSSIYERTYEVGLRYVKHFGIVAPYVRGSYGRGVFNFPNNSFNQAYNIFSGGGGVDVRVQRHVNVRADYEFQTWLNFPDNGLTPQVVTLGAAYHF